MLARALVVLNAEKRMPDGKAAAFAGTLAEFCDRHLVPLLFAPYAAVVAERAKALAWSGSIGGRPTPC